MTKDNATRAKEPGPSEPHVDDFDEISTGARRRLAAAAQRITEAPPATTATAHLDLPPEHRPFQRHLAGRNLTSDSAKAQRHRVELVRRILADVGFEPAQETACLDDVAWQLVTPSVAMAFRSNLVDRYPNHGTKNLFLVSLRGLMKSAAAGGLISVDQHRQIIGELEYFKVEKSKPGQAIPTEVFVGLVSAAQTFKPLLRLRDVAILRVFQCTGLRACELVSLDIDDIDLEARTGTVILAKSHVRHSFWLSREAVLALREWIDLRGAQAGPLFTTSHGRADDGRLTTSGLYSILDRLNAAIPQAQRVTSHDFRRTLITTALRQGVDVFTVSRLVGHRNVSSTEAYDYRTPDEDLEAIDSLFPQEGETA
jgi:integrase